MTRDQGIAAAIHDEIERLILEGTWKPGQRIPTEAELTVRYGCARMTVHKALARLAERGLIVRRRRAGSFVAAPPAEQAVLTIGDFAEEAARTGQRYTHEILLCREIPAPVGDFLAGEPLLLLHCLHRLDDTPVAWEERLIRIAAVPAARAARFEREAPGTWLLRHVPWSQAEHEITAANAEAGIARHLNLRRGAALLCLRRRTWYAGGVITDVRLSFPADRHCFTARFSPSVERNGNKR